MSAVALETRTVAQLLLKTLKRGKFATKIVSQTGKIFKYQLDLENC